MLRVRESLPAATATLPQTAASTPPASSPKAAVHPGSPHDVRRQQRQQQHTADVGLVDLFRGRNLRNGPIPTRLQHSRHRNARAIALTMALSMWRPEAFGL